MSLFCGTVLLQIVYALSVEPNPPVWSPSVYIFNPGNDSYTQSIVNKIFKENGGENPTFNGQWSQDRYALLFLPGSYNVDVNVGYYTSVIGLGIKPSDTIIQNVISSNGASGTEGASCNFWRSAENFMTTPTFKQNGHWDTMMWAVSQGASLRRVIINGNLDLYQSNGYSSGGYLSNSYISGIINSGTQQQWYTRNTFMKSWNGGNWNMVYQGVLNTPNDVCQNRTSLYKSINSTPVIAEKPFISYENGKYYLMIPPIEYNKVGPTDFNSSNTILNIQQIDFENVYVTDSRITTASIINSKIAAGLHIVLTAGNYNFTEPIQVTKSNITILGIGYPTLMSMNGNIIIEVSDGLQDVRISSILFQAGPKNTSTLLQFGSMAGSGNGYNFLYDIFARVGGPNNQYTTPWMSHIMVQINSNNVIFDNSWLWRADHDITGNVVSSNNPVAIGLQVYGDNVISYALKVEHTLENMVEWYGNNGSCYMFQSEFPYDVNQAQYGQPGFNAFRVDENVKSFQGYGIGMYSFFRDYNVTVKNAIQSPQNQDNVQFTNVFTIWLAGKGQINHVIDGMGAAVNIQYRDTPSTVCKLHP
eukprot:468998_1